MIFAAGLGTRLGALTRGGPKALVPVGGVPMLERIALRLVSAGAERLIINTHHFAEKVVEFAHSRGDFGVEVVFSHEIEAPLETGGGLMAASKLFRAEAPIILHNVDVFSEIPLEPMYAHHVASGRLATLAVMERATSRRLLFDDQGLLGRVDDRKGLRIESRPARGAVRERAFAGIHVVSPELLSLIVESGTFSILDPYIRLAAEGYRIDPYDVAGHAWVDIGKPDQLETANRWLKSRSAT